MGKSIVFLAMVVLMAVIGNYAIAEEYYLEKNTEGKFRVAGWQKTEIRVEEKALPYESFFQEAIEKPGVPVTVKEREEQLIELKLFEETYFIQKKGIVYDDSANLINFIDNSELKEEQGPTILLGTILFSVFLMIISNICFFLNIDKGMSLLLIIISAISIYAPFLFQGNYFSNNTLLESGLLFSLFILFIGTCFNLNKICKCGAIGYYLLVCWFGYLFW